MLYGAMDRAKRHTRDIPEIYQRYTSDILKADFYIVFLY